MGILYIIATPIGNLRDITYRAVETLKNVDAIVCEDTRRTGILLQQLNISGKKPQLISYYEQNEQQRIPQIITAIKNGLSVALVSDSGTPAISDPGFKLVRECIREGIKVESVPGPSSVITALVSSGLPTDKFIFLGFLPRKSGHRNKLLENIKKVSSFIKSTIIIFEAPHRLARTLEEMSEVFGDIDIAICRELTKVHEEIRREKISESIEHFTKNNPKGEITVLFNLEDIHEKI